MKQVLQDLRTGGTEIVDVPCPGVTSGTLLIRSSRSLVSVGTERMLVEFGRANLIDKARQQPDKVRQVLDKVRTDGLVPTIETVRNKLAQPLPLGYCNVGTVLEVGANVSNFSPGDRVASNGKHAEVVNVPKNLCARISDDVDDESAAFTVIGAIALQGIRLTAPTLGETIVVTGLGLIGLMAVQLLKAQGCRVIGIDLDPARLELARKFGAETVDLSTGQDPITSAQSSTKDRGVDAVLITASTKSHKPIHQAAQMCRQRGRIVLIGVTGLELSRADFYEKELTFQISCSYGPGRYDRGYEEEGYDYPLGFVRWTEQRNFEAVLDMMAEGRLDVKPLISHRFSIDAAKEAYKIVGGAEPSLGIMLEYPLAKARDTTTMLNRSVRFADKPVAKKSKACLGFIGAGSYANDVLIPAFKAAGASLVSVASNGGVSSLQACKKFGFQEATTDVGSILSNPDINAVVITTRHDSHARFVLEAMEAGKHLFVEKPLCLTRQELSAIQSTYISKKEAGTPLLLMVGFNRRFAPHVQKLKTLICGRKAPKTFIMTVNAGPMPANHWTQDRTIGGGRIVGEACHFIDLLRYLAASPIKSHQRISLNSTTQDTVTLQLSFEDGTIGTIHYFANGNKSFPKERLELFCAGQILQLDNFRRLKGFGWPGFTKLNLMGQDKGQKACAAAFVNALHKGDPPPILFDEIVEVSHASIVLSGD